MLSQYREKAQNLINSSSRSQDVSLNQIFSHQKVSQRLRTLNQDAYQLSVQLSPPASSHERFPSYNHHNFLRESFESGNQTARNDPRRAGLSQDAQLDALRSPQTSRPQTQDGQQFRIKQHARRVRLSDQEDLSMHN